MPPEGRKPLTAAAALLLFAASFAAAVGCFLGIVRRYGKRGGRFPWLYSLGFAAASIAALAALRALLAS